MFERTLSRFDVMEIITYKLVDYNTNKKKRKEKWRTISHNSLHFVVLNMIYVHTIFPSNRIRQRLELFH